MNEWKTFITTKVVNVIEMTAREAMTSHHTIGNYSHIKNMSTPARETPGYLIDYGDGYLGWCPADKFEPNARPITPDQIKLIIG